ncbi:MAG: hypothetical protein E7037_00220 [Verrucomicrobia bacterium]|nr:hypothetical protein [Verrucomicrobiota bacterium]
MPPKKNNTVSVVVFAVLAVLWGVEIIFFYESLDRAQEERDRLVEQERVKAEERAQFERRAEELREYTDRMIKDPDFVGAEAREITGGAVEGEVVIRPDGV